ncbi:MAG: hypothetical protein K0R63_896 [Rickettsiales bacterium]|jgi:hypothetical protein|nr:hypothetical protein [Rickettsiales bacterium]
MKKVLTVASLALAAVVSTSAIAATPAKEAAKPEAAKAAAPAASAAARVIELQNGSKAKVEGENVSIEQADGSAKPAPDGVHTAKDGQTITTKGGKIVQ